MWPAWKPQICEGGVAAREEKLPREGDNKTIHTSWANLLGDWLHPRLLGQWFFRCLAFTLEKLVLGLYNVLNSSNM